MFVCVYSPDLVHAPRRLTMLRWGPRWVIIFSSDIRACFSLERAVAATRYGDREYHHTYSNSQYASLFFPLNNIVKQVLHQLNKISSKGYAATLTSLSLTPYICDLTKLWLHYLNNLDEQCVRANAKDECIDKWATLVSQIPKMNSTALRKQACTCLFHFLQYLYLRSRCAIPSQFENPLIYTHTSALWELQWQQHPSY